MGGAHPTPSDADRLVDAFLASSRTVAPAPAMSETLALLAREAGGAGLARDAAVESLARKLIIDTMRALSARTSSPTITPTGDASRVAIALRFLEDNFSRDVGVADVAAQMHVSERHARRLVQHATGLSILQHLTRLRLGHARGLLRHRPHMPIKQVADASGYPDVSYFTALFRKHTGKTPAEYRRR